MTSYRLILWSRRDNRLRERSVVTDDTINDEHLLDTFERIGRSALAGDDSLPATVRIARDARQQPRKLVRIRRHLTAARRLLEDMGEYMLAARATAPLDELERRDGKACASLHLQA